MLAMQDDNSNHREVVITALPNRPVDDDGAVLHLRIGRSAQYILAAFFGGILVLISLYMTIALAWRHMARR